MLTKKLPVGVDSFEKLRKEDFYYVDKTGLIADIVQNWGEVNIFTRPRRFGKTLNMSMLKSFFEIGGDKSIFEGTEIAQNQQLCETYMGKYPVVFISLKGVDGLKFEDAYIRLKDVIRDECLRLSYLRDSANLGEHDVGRLNRILEDEADANDIAASLKMLSYLLEKYYGQKAIILIDEYDVPLDKAYAHGYYTQMIDLIRAMLGSALKTNDSLFFAVLTGCLRVSKESIFTGLNNLKTRSITDARFDEYFGFTDEEVRKLLADYGLEDHYGEVHDWYDGYLFGNQNIYCPWDVINYCDDLNGDPHAEPQAYWMNTSGNDIVRMLIDKCDSGTTRMEVEDLISGQTITKNINEQLTHNEIDANINNIWSLLYMTGYLTVTQRPSDGYYTLKIPNREVRQIFKQQVLAWFNDKTRAEADKLADLFAAFTSGDTEAITKYLNKQLVSTISFYDAKESFYHGFMLALLSTCANWRVSSNDEAGAGRADIIVERTDGDFGFVVELKVVKDRKQLDEACQAAMQQIDDRDYTANLRLFCIEDIRAYAIAFCGKRCRVIGKKIEYTDDY